MRNMGVSVVMVLIMEVLITPATIQAPMHPTTLRAIISQRIMDNILIMRMVMGNAEDILVRT